MLHCGGTGVELMDIQATMQVKVWDSWTRLVHWSIVVLILLSYWSIQTGRTQTHYLSGYTVLRLVFVRIAWGLVGSDTARFRRFLRSPLAAFERLREFHRRE